MSRLSTKQRRAARRRRALYRPAERRRALERRYAALRSPTVRPTWSVTWAEILEELERPGPDSFGGFLGVISRRIANRLDELGVPVPEGYMIVEPKP